MRGWTRVAAAAGLLMSVPAAAQELFPHINAAIARMEARWGGRPHAQTLAWQIVGVDRGLAARANVTAPDYGRITAIGGCDRDCTGVRLRVLDYRGRPIVQAEGHDGSGLVSFDPQPGQTYAILVEPLNCSTALCYVAWTAVR